MYQRDVAVLLLSGFALFLTLQHEGTFSFRKAWHHQPTSQDDELSRRAHEQLPSPVVADLNGDGSLEVLLVTQDHTLQVIQPRPAGRAGDGFAAATVVAEVSLLPAKVTVGAGRQAVALSAGFIDPVPRELVRSPRKQVVVVVTATLHVMCFDHNLKLLWDQALHEREFPPHAHVHEVAIYISPHQVKNHDHGLVVIGASVEYGDLASDTEGMLDELDVLEEELRNQREEQSRERSAGAKDKMLDVDVLEDEVAGVDTTRHFSYYAFEAATGSPRWVHDSRSFHKAEADQVYDQEHPQHDFKLDVERLASKHAGEASCRDYRESLLHAMPHSWHGQHDTMLEEAYFVKHREGKGHQKHHLAHKAEANKLGHHGGATARHTHRAKGTSAFSWGHVFGGKKAAGRGGVRKHVPQNVQSGTRHHDPGGNHTINALVAHLQDGIEVVHLYTGRTMCMLHLSEGALHADLNGDGMVDHVQVSSGSTEQGLGHAFSSRHHVSGHCSAVVTSGVPPRETLFRTQVCSEGGHHGLGDVLGAVSEEAQEEEEQQVDQHVEVAPPVMLPVARADGTYSRLRGQRGMLVFLTSTGEVRGVSHSGDLLWQVHLMLTWEHAAADGQGYSEVPTLKQFALRVHSLPTTVLAAGSQFGTIISEHGHVLADLDLQFPPTEPLVIADFNGDGLNDVILVTGSGVYGYQQVHHIGGLSLSALVLTLVVAMGIVYFAQHPWSVGSARSRRLRSTETTD